MSSNSTGSKGSLYAIVAVGIVLAFAGYWFSVNVHLAFVESLNKQGIHIDPGITISMIGMFLVLFPGLNYFYFKPLGDAIGQRTSDLEATFAEAEDLRSEMQKMRSDYEKRLVETESNARDQIQSTIREAQNLRTQLMSEASARADELLTRAQQEIESEKQKAIVDLRIHVVDLSLGAATKVLGENLDNERNRKLVSEFIQEVEVPA